MIRLCIRRGVVETGGSLRGHVCERRRVARVSQPTSQWGELRVVAMVALAVTVRQPP